jgi:hypothetical protein
LALGEAKRFAGACQVELVPLIIVAVAWIIAKAAGPTAEVIQEWLRLRYRRYLHDQAVARGQDPDPVEMIRADSEGASSSLAESTKLKALPGQSSNKPPKKKAS